MLVVSDTSWDGYTEVPRTVIEGYSTIFAELDEQLAGAAPEVVVVPMGVGALAAAVVEHYSATAQIIAVEPLTRRVRVAFRRGRATGVRRRARTTRSWPASTAAPCRVVAWPTVSRGVDLFVAIGDRAAEQAMRDLAGHRRDRRRDRSSIARRALRAVARSEPITLAGRRVLVLCTEGATDPVAYERIVGRAPPPPAG